MADFVVILTESEEQLVAGVPRTVTLSTDIPSMIFYTLDGTDPNPNSFIATTEPIDMPGMIGATIKAYGYNPVNTPQNTPLLSETFGTAIDSDKIHRIGEEGIAVDRAEDFSKSRVITHIDEDGYEQSVDGYLGTDISIVGYGADGYAVSFSDGYISDYDVRFSDTDSLGIPPGVKISVGEFKPIYTKDPSDDDRLFRETISNNPYFNPKAMYIDIDQNDAYNEVNIIGRPWGSTRDMTRFWGSTALHNLEAKKYISGGLARAMYNPNTKIYASYYFDHADTRWVKSVNKIDIELPKTGGAQGANTKRVFKWVLHKRRILR